MISSSFITEWSAKAPWQLPEQIEQDLIISRALIEIFSNDILTSSLAFRGGTALYKIFLNKAWRYSEDLDFVQITAGPIGPILDNLKNALDHWLPSPPVRKIKEGRVCLIYKFQAEESSVFMRLKIEINSREHFAINGIQHKKYELSSRWFSGKCDITTYKIEELLATKLRALYQRKKGRDLFDFYAVFHEIENLNDQLIIETFKKYLQFEKLTVSKAQFTQNLLKKMEDPAFNNDIFPLLPINRQSYDAQLSAHNVIKRLLELLN